MQWQIRTVKSVDELLQQVEYFVDAFSDYQCDAALFPEFFSAPLMGLENHRTSLDAVKTMTEFTEEIVQAISKMAVAYNITIIAGSMPVMEDGLLYKVGLPMSTRRYT